MQAGEGLRDIERDAELLVSRDQSVTQQDREVGARSGAKAQRCRTGRLPQAPWFEHPRIRQAGQGVNDPAGPCCGIRDVRARRELQLPGRYPKLPTPRAPEHPVHRRKVPTSDQRVKHPLLGCFLRKKIRLVKGLGVAVRRFAEDCDGVVLIETAIGVAAVFALAVPFVSLISYANQSLRDVSYVHSAVREVVRGVAGPDVTFACRVEIDDPDQPCTVPLWQGTYVVVKKSSIIPIALGLTLPIEARAVARVE